jgi:Holliday junction resolvase
MEIGFPSAGSTISSVTICDNESKTIHIKDKNGNTIVVKTEDIESILTKIQTDADGNQYIAWEELKKAAKALFDDDNADEIEHTIVIETLDKKTCEVKQHNLKLSLKDLQEFILPDGEWIDGFGELDPNVWRDVFKNTTIVKDGESFSNIDIDFGSGFNIQGQKTNNTSSNGNTSSSYVGSDITVNRSKKRRS